MSRKSIIIPIHSTLIFVSFLFVKRIKHSVMRKAMMDDFDAPPRYEKRYNIGYWHQNKNKGKNKSTIDCFIYYITNLSWVQREWQCVAPFGFFPVFTLHPNGGSKPGKT